MLAGLLLLSVPAISQNPSIQVFEEWSSAGGTINFYQKNRTITDASGNVYVTGTTLNAFGNYDILTAKYSSKGVLKWQQVYSGSGGGDDGAADVILDPSGNVYVTGSYYKNSVDSNNAITIKYDTAGVFKWSQEYNGSGSRNDGTVRLEIDGSYIYAVGSAYSGSSDLYDFLIIKYSLTGTQQWASVWDNAGLMDGAVRVKVKNNKVTVAGGSQVNLTQYKYAVANFAVSNGAFQNAHTSGGNQTIAFDKVTDLLVDNNGDVFITGGVQNTGVGYDIRTVKLDQNNLGIQWTATYNGSSNLDDVGNSIAQDANGDVYVTGFETVTGQGKNYATIKYANNNGATQWTKIYNDQSNGDDEAVAVGVQGTSRIYVTGSSFNGSTLDYYTISYNASNGNLIWQTGYNGLANKDDRAADLAVTGSNELIVTGTAYENPFAAKYITVKYVEKNTLMPQDTITATSSSFVFTENRGQLFGTDTAKHPEVKFYTIHSIPQVYFMDTAVSYVFANIDTTSTHDDTLVRVDMKFKNSNSGQKIRSLDQRSDYANFYLGHIPAGREHVSSFNQLVNFNVWNNVDVVYGSNLRGLKYYFICKPGGGGTSASQIDLFYNGADSVKIDANGQLIIHTRFGNVVQPKAAAWQLDANGNYQSLGWQPSYSLLGTNEVGFTGFGSYNPLLPIVVAVDWGNLQFSSVTNPRWSTYLGGSNDDWGTDIKSNTTTDEVFTTGLTYSMNFPKHVAYDGSLGGSTDAYYGCFKTDRSRRWVTYFGGSDYDNGSQIELGTNAMLYGTGSTYSSDFPALFSTGVYHETTTSTTSTAYVVKLLQSTGVGSWSTRFGSNNTSGIAIELDASNNVYISGNTTNSTAGSPTCAAPTNSGFPLCDPGSGAYYDNTFSSTGSASDAFLAKFTSNGGILWSTYFGGAGIDKSYDLFIATNGNLYLVGSTTTSVGSNNPCGVPSNNGFPLCAPNNGTYFQTSYSGGIDGYLTEFAPGLQLSWSTYIGGTNDEIVSSVIVTTSGSIYLGGVTLTSTPDATTCNTPTGGGFPNCAVNPSYTQNYMTGGGSDAFILRFKNEDLIWGSYLGGDGQDGYISGASSLPVLTFDANSIVYAAITSFTPNSSSNNPAQTQSNGGMNYNFSNNHDATVGNYGYSEALIYAFTSSNTMLWGTYFGGTGAITVTGPDYGEMPTGIHCGSSSLFVTGTLNTTAGFPVTGPVAGSYMQGTTTVNTNPGGADAFITEFDVSQVVGIDETETESEMSISVFPNPAMDGTLNLILHSSTDDDATVRIFDALGNVVYEKNQALTANGYTPIDISSLSSGMYLIQVESESGMIYTQKFVIEK